VYDFLPCRVLYVATAISFCAEVPTGATVTILAGVSA
jgi:hypothetical protein